MYIIDMHITGIIIGWLIVAGCLYEAMNFFVKLIYRKNIVKLPSVSPFRKKYTRFMRAVAASHIYVPMFLITLIVLHSLIELIHKGFFVTGIITLIFLMLQYFIGYYGTYFKNKKKGHWFYAHRTVDILLFFTIAIHVIDAIMIKP